MRKKSLKLLAGAVIVISVLVTSFAFSTYQTNQRLEKELQTKDTRITNLESNLSEAKSEVEKKNNKIDKLDSRIEELQQTKSNLRSQLEKPMVAAFDDEYSYVDRNTLNVEFNAYNFGDRQAQDLTATLQILNENDQVVQEEVLDIGSLASGKYDYYTYEIEADEGVTFDDSKYGVIKISTCQDCVILKDRLNADYLYSNS